MAEGGKTFSRSVKEELADAYSPARHCQIAELCAIASLEGGRIDGNGLVLVSTEHEALARKVFTLLQKAFNIRLEISKLRKKSSERAVYEIRTEDPRIRRIVMKALEHPDLRKKCCARAFLRGAFLAAGTVSDPERYYRLEIVLREEADAERVAGIMRQLLPEVKQTARGGGYVVYLQEGDVISRALALMDAPLSVLSLENTRVLREMRGNVSRRLNCEMSNLNKTAQAAGKQIRDIRFLRETGKMEELPEQLREIAMVREQNPEASLTELGELLPVKIGRSGVNHRLRKLSQIAEDLREER